MMTILRSRLEFVYHSDVRSNRVDVGIGKGISKLGITGTWDYIK